MSHRNYDVWKTAHSDPDPLWCSECGHHEAVDTISIEDPEEPGFLKQVSPCHLCVGQFKKLSAGGEHAAADVTRKTPAIQPNPAPFQ